MSRTKIILSAPVAHAEVSASRIQGNGDSMSKTAPRAGKVKTQHPPRPAASPASDDYPRATADYINVYRERWDSEDQETKEPEQAGDLSPHPEAKP